MPEEQKKDYKRYITAGLTFSTILLIGFVMQNGQKNAVKTPAIATANMGNPAGPAALPQPRQDAVPVAVPGTQTSAAALDVNQGGQDSMPMPSLGETTDVIEVAPEATAADLPAHDTGKGSKIVASLADVVTWGGRDRSTSAATQAVQTSDLELAEAPAPQSYSQAETMAGAHRNGTLSTLDGDSYQTASLGGAESQPMPSETRQAPAVAGNCEVSLKAAPQAAALVDLTLEAPCLPNDRVTIHHNGMMFTETTDMNGSLMISVPALTETATFIASFPNGDGATATATVTSLGFYDRAVVQSEAETAVSLHALEFGAEYDDAGHINADAPGDIAKAAAGEGGFLMVLGNPQIAKGMMAQVYSFPAGFAADEGEIALSVEIEVTDANCGRPIDAQSIEALQGGALSVQTLDMTMPDCDAVGDFLVLKNLVNDLKVARN